MTRPMPRPRQIDDELLLSAAGSVLAEVGPAKFTLERAAQRATVSAATYIKRFGSKKALLVEMNRRWLESIDGELADAVATVGTPLERLRAAALWGVQDMDDAGTAGRQLVALAKDLQDDDLRAQLAEGLARIRTVLETLGLPGGLGRRSAGGAPVGTGRRPSLGTVGGHQDHLVGRANRVADRQDRAGP